ncbi:MAG: hypothetical protein M5U30_07870 [Burkholderiaceae bacterium]|nr:hypothetical protein [Burkholderiaceae bacterium]
MDLRKGAVPLCALALAACGGGGGGGGDNVNPVNQMSVDAKELRAFIGDLKTLRVDATDLLGNLIGNPTLTWSTSAAGIATAAPGTQPSTGAITAVSAGGATVTVSSNGRKVDTPIQVYAKPESVADLQKVFPWFKTGLGVSTYSDIGSAENDARFAHFSSLWTYMSGGTGLLPTSGAPSSAEFYFTRDVNVLLQGRDQCNAVFETPPSVGSVMSCSDGMWGGPETTERWFYVAPSNPLSQDQAQMQHELAEAFFEHAVPDEQEFAWLYKGSTQYYEAGVLSGSTSFSVDVASLKKRLVADPTANWVPSTAPSVIMQTPYAATAGEKTIHDYSYGPAALILFLQTDSTYADKLRPVIDKIVAGTITSNSAAVTELLSTAGKTAQQLDDDYAAWRTANAL